LAKHNIIPQVEHERAMTDLEYDEMAANNRDRLGEEARHKKAAKEIDEDEEAGLDDDDDDFLKKLREKRISQIQANVLRNRFGTLMEIGQTDYKSEVTNAAEDIFVVVFLYKQG
jgi:hypothetical protein